MAKVWKFGDAISTDLIIPGRYLTDRSPEHLGKHAMAGEDPDFSDKIDEGDIIIAGKNFGCGSSREHAPIALKSAGIEGIIAESFARIFYRNAINQGIPVLTHGEIREKFDQNDEIEVNWETGEIKNLTTGEKLETDPLPSLLQKIIDEGGIIQKLKNKQ